MKKILGIIAVFLLFFLIIGTVSAEYTGLNNTLTDNNLTLENNITDSLIENTSHSHTQMSNISDSPIKSATITASGGTFSQLQSLISSASSWDTINITGDYYSTGSQLTINKNIILEGNNHILDGAGLNRIMDVTGAYTLIINNLTLKNGRIGIPNSGWVDGGGAIRVLDKSATIYLNYCDFINNTIIKTGTGNIGNTHGAGGALLFSNINSAYISHCNFFDNAGYSYATAAQYNIPLYGGALFSIKASVISITNSSFINNHLFHSSSTNLYVEAGGFYIQQTSSYLLVDQCIFINNSAYSNSIVYYDVDFFDNAAGGAKNVVNSWWGVNKPNWSSLISRGVPETWVVMNFTNTSSFSSSPVTLETSLNWVYNSTSNSYQQLDSNLHVRNVTYTVSTGSISNTIKEFSGSDIESYSYPTGTTNMFLTATIDNQQLNISNPLTLGTFTHLQALIDATPNGGVLVLDKNYSYDPPRDLPYTQGMFINKSITIEGNGYTISGINLARIFNISAGNVVINNVNFIDGYWGTSTYSNGGGALIISGVVTNVTLNKCNFSNNFVQAWGGAILATRFDTMIIRDCSFVNNTETYGTWSLGGAIAIHACQDHVMNHSGNYVGIFNSSFINNSIQDATGGQVGAAIYSTGLTRLDIFDSIFEDNKCRDSTLQSRGGAIYFDYGSYLNVNNNVFYNNYAQTGSEIYTENTGNTNLNNNWWGTNTPNWSSITAGMSPLETYVVMNFTNTTPINYSADSSTLKTTLNTVYNFTSGSYQPLMGTVPSRIVNYNSTKGVINPSTTNIKVSNTINFIYPANMGVWIVNATIDGQTLWLGSLDLGINITPSVNPVFDGGNISYIISVVNNGLVNASFVNVSLVLPSFGLNITNFTNYTGSFNSSTGEWYIGNLTVGSTVYLVLNCTVMDPGPFLIWNATVNDGGEYDHYLDNNTIVTNVTVIQIADLEIHKNLTENITPQAKDNITYMIRVYNNGPSTAINVTVFDNLSGKLIFINSSATQGYYNETTGIWFIDNITPYSNETLNITVNINKSGFVDNKVNVTNNITDNNLTNNYDNYSFTTPSLSDLWVTITMEPQTSNYITYHIQAGNNGIEDANGTVVVFNLSNLYVYFNHTEDKGQYDNLTGVWDIGELNVNETVNMTLIVRLDFPMGTTFANVTTSVNISSWSTDLYPQNNTDNVTFEAEIFGNFRLLQDIVNSWAENTTQILPRSFAYDPVQDAKWANETYDLIDGVRLYKNVTIVNPNGFTLGGFNMARIFNISADNVILHGLKFYDGYSPLGAAINIHADNVQILRSNFTHNTLFGDYGGAIFTNGRNTLIMDNIFTENSATKLGGAVGAVRATNLQIINNTFINNTVESDEVFGGAVGIANSSAIVNNNVFLDNWATNAPNLGSAIYTYNSNVNLNDNWFGNNTPDMVTDNLIWGVKPETYVVLDWEIVNPNMTGVELNVVFLSYNRTSGTKTPLSDGLPYRNLTVVARDPTLSWYNKTYTGNNSVNYTYNPSIPIYLVNATVDYQTITFEWSTILDVNKSLVNDTIWFGDDLIYNITLVNYGPHDSYIVTVSDLLPENLTINDVNATYGSTSIIGDNAYWTISINAGSTLNFIVNTTPTSEGVYVNNLTVNSTGQYDYFWHRNRTNATAEVMPLADLSVNITISNPPYYVGEEINYTIVIHNKGPSNATNVSVYIPIPTGLTFLYAWSLIGYIPNYTSSTGLWNVGILHVNETIEINMTLRLDNPGWYNQTVNITGHVIDINNTNDNDTVSFNVSTQVDLELNMTINKNITIAGDTNVKITYSLINKGPSPATNVSVFTVFNGLTYLSASGYGIFNNLTPFTAYWIVGNLSKNQLVTITLTFNASNLGSFTVTGRANCSDNESYWPDNYDNVTLDVTEYADLSITKTVSNSTPFLLHNVTYTITVRNNGPYNAYNVTVYDLLPSVLVYDNLTTGFNGTEWFVDNLTPGESRNISFNVTVDGIGDIWNNVTVNSSTPDSDYSNNHDEVVIHVPVADDLRIYLNVLPSTPSSNTMFLINVSVWNYGYEDNNDVYVEFHIPSGLSWVSDTSSGAYDHTTGIWNIGVLGNGQWTNIEIWVTPSVVGNVTIQANVTGQVADPAPWNNRANLTFEIVPSFDLTITKTANATSITDGDYVTFYINVSNKGPYTAKDVTIIDSLPNGVIYLINNASGVYDNNTRTVNWTISNLGVNESRLIELRVRSWGPGTSFTNFVNVSAYGVDSNITDNAASVTVNVSQVVDLEVILTASKVVDIDLGENITFYVTVVNHGPSNATGVIANFIVPSIFTLIGENSTGTYNNITGDWLIGNLGSGEKITLALNVTLSSTGKCVANATVNGTYPDTNTTNNYDELNITATRLSDLNITAYWSNNSIFWYDLSNLTIIVCNGGPDDAINVTVSVNVPGLTFVNSTGNFNNTTMVWNIGNLSVGQFKNITISFNGTVCGLWNATGNIIANGIDNDTNNNNFTINITVLPVVDLIMTNLTVNATFTALDSILEFNVTVYNAGPCNATNTTILGLLPVNWTIYGGSTVADIPVNTSHTFNILVNASSCGNFTVGFNATIDGLDTNISNNWMYIGPIEVIYSCDLMITIKASNNMPSAGDIVVYVVTVSNLDWRTAHNVTANVTIPSNLSFDHYYLASGVYNPFNGTWNIGDLSFRNSTSLFLFCRVSVPGNTSFWVNVTGDDYDFILENNNDTVIFNTGIGLDLNITISVDNSTPYIGDNVTFTVVVENPTSIDATGVSVDLNIPFGFVNITTADLNFTGTSWYVGNLSGGSSKTLTFTATPIIMDNLTVNSTVNCNEFDYNLTNNFANLTISPIGVSDLEVNISCNNINPMINEIVTYTISVLNKGLVSVDTVLVYNNLPYSTVYSISIPSYNPSLKLWTIINLTPNTIQTLNITINHTTTGIFNYTVNMTGNIIEFNTTNNLDNITITVNDYNDLITYFTVSNTSVIDNGLLNFTITVYNNGTFNYTNVLVYTDLPETTQYNGSGVFDTNLGLWDVGNLTGGENKTLSLTINMTNVGNCTYWANATSKEEDRDLSNNNRSLNLSVFSDFNLKVNLTVSSVVVNVSDVLVFTVNVWNEGPSTAYNVVCHDTIIGTVLGISKGYYVGSDWHIGNLTGGELVELNLSFVPTVVTSSFVFNTSNFTTDDGISGVLMIGGVPVSGAVISYKYGVNPTSSSSVSSGILYADYTSGTVVTDSNGVFHIPTLYYGHYELSYGGMNAYVYVHSSVPFTGGMINTTLLYDFNRCTRLNYTLGDHLILTGYISHCWSYNGVPLPGDVPIYLYSISNPGNIYSLSVWDDANALYTLGTYSSLATGGLDEEIIFNFDLYDLGSVLSVGDNQFFFVAPSNRSLTDNNIILLSINGAFINISSNGPVHSSVLSNNVLGSMVGDVVVYGGSDYWVWVTSDGSVYERNLSDNNASVNVQVVNTVDLVLNITSNVSSIASGDSVNISVMVFNNASRVMHNLTVNLSSLFNCTVLGYFVGTGYVSGDLWVVGDVNPFDTVGFDIILIPSGNVLCVNASCTDLECDYSNNNASLILDIVKFTDLLVTITVNDTNPSIGDNVTFTVTVYNNGNDTAENVTVYLDLPYSTFYSDVYMYDSLQGIWDVGTLLNGTNKTLNITVTLNNFGIIIFNATVNTSTNDVNLTNNEDNVTLNISNLVDLNINVTVNSTNLFVGDNVTFIIVVTNKGPGNATGVNASINLPGSISYINKGVYSSGVWSIGNLNKDETVTLNLTRTLTLADEGVYLLNVLSTDLDSNLTDNNVTLNLSLNSSSDLEIQIISSAGIVNVSSPLNYTVIVFNHGINNITSANVNFTLSNDFIISSNMTSNGIFNGNIWTLGTLNAGDNATLYIYGSYNSSGNKTIGVFVNSTNYDVNMTNNYANTTVFITSQVDLCVNFTSTGYYNPDGTITFNITVTNYDPSVAENITVYTNLDLTSDYNATNGYFDTLQNIWYINTLNVGESETLIINTTAIGGIQYYANVTSSTEELNKSDNIKYLNLTVNPLADLAINITANTTLLHIGDSVNFTVTVVNLGPYNATGVNVYSSLPASPDYMVNKGLYDTLNGNWSVGNLSVGETATLNLIFNITSTGTYTYIVNVTGTSNDTNISNNNDSINLTVDETADLSIKILTNITTFTVGENVTFTLNVTNHGLNNATNITVFFTLENFTINNINVSIGTFDNGTWNITELENNTGLVLNITGFFTANGTKNIYANVTSLTYDNDTSNNFDTLSCFVINPFDLEISINANVTCIYAGKYIELSVNVTNQGRGIAENILIKTNILNATSIKPNGYYDKDTGYIFIETLGANSTIIINLTKQVTINTTFTVNITNSDLNNTNNNDSIFINVSDCADLNITVTANTLNPYFDDDLTYTITVTNVGYSLAENVLVNTTLLDTGFKFVNANSTDYINGLWAIGNLSIGESTTLTVNFKTNKSGLVSTEFNTTTSTYESNTLNNFVNLTVNVSNNYKPSDDLVDLIINITVNNTSPNINETVLFNITVFNNASTNATNLTILSFLPNGLAPLGAYTGNWTVSNLTGYGNVSFTFVANVTSYGSFVTNTSVDCVELDRNAINNRANVLVVSSAPSTNYIDLTVNVTRVGNLTLGETFTYNITVINTGSSIATDVNCTISLFTGLNVVNQSTLDYNDTLCLWNVGNLTGGASKSLELTVNITSTGYYNNAFLVWSNENDVNPQNNLALDYFQINDTKVDINVRIMANKTYVSNNETILFTVTVTNPRLNTATDVNVTLDIPNEFAIVSFVGNDTNSSYYIGNLTPGGVFNFTFAAKLNSTNASTITVNATLNETDQNIGDNVDSITILPLGVGTDGVADLHINITVNEQYPEVGTVPIFTIWVTNFGPDNATNVVIPVYVPENCTNTAFYANASGVIWNTSTNTITIPQVAVGEIVYTDIYYCINTTVPIIFNVSASSDQFDPNITDNKASISLYPWEATPTCDLNITIVPMGSDFHAGDIIKFNVTIRNYGEKTAHNVTVSSIVPSGLTLMNITSSSSFVQTSDGWFISNVTKTVSEASAKSFIVAYNITNKGLYHTTMEVNTSTVDVDPTSNGMGVAIYAGEFDARIKLPTNLTNPAFSGGTALNATKGDLLKFKSRLTALNDTTNTMKNFADQVLYANITSSDGTFSITVESIDLTLGTNGYANFAVNSSLLLVGTTKYNITVFYKGNSTSDYVYLPTVSKTVQRQLNIKT